MTKNDFPVIVYLILNYLYECLRDEKPVCTDCLKHDGTLFNINFSYWKYIFDELLDRKWITCACINDYKNKSVTYKLETTCLLTKGLEALFNDPVVQKGSHFLSPYVMIGRD